MPEIRWDIDTHRGNAVLSLWVGPACIYGTELEGTTAEERDREARSIRRRFGQALIEDQIEDG